MVKRRDVDDLRPSYPSGVDAALLVHSSTDGRLIACSKSKTINGACGSAWCADDNSSNDEFVQCR